MENDDWPEPIVPVQSLADSCSAVVPDRYIKPPNQRPSSSSSDNGLNIPTVDLGKLAGDTAGETIEAIADACANWGFFQVVNHGVSPDLLRSVVEVWREFFHLPMPEKKKYSNSPRTYEGYGSRLGVEKGAILDWGDYFFLHFSPNSLKDHRKWPALPSSCRDVVEEYGRQLLKLCGNLMRLLSVSLGLRVNQLQESFGGEEIGACLRVNFYPKCPQPDLTLGLSSHSDPGGLTLLLQDQNVTGLQVRKGDRWITVSPVTDAIIVNVGDQIQPQSLSNGTFKSVEHRAVTNATTERLSLAFFYNPKSDLPIEPLPELVSPEKPALYQMMTFDEYRTYIRKKGPQGKNQLESRKATSVKSS